MHGRGQGDGESGVGCGGPCRGHPHEAVEENHAEQYRRRTPRKFAGKEVSVAFGPRECAGESENQVDDGEGAGSGTCIACLRKEGHEVMLEGETREQDVIHVGCVVLPPDVMSCWTGER